MCVDTNREKNIRSHLPLFRVIIVIDDDDDYDDDADHDDGHDHGDASCEKQSAIVPVCPCMLLLGIPNKWEVLTALYLGHFSELCFQHTTLRDEATPFPWQRAGLLTATVKAMNSSSSLVLNNDSQHIPWFPVVIHMGIEGTYADAHVAYCAGSKILYHWTSSLMSSASLHEPAASLQMG